VTGGLAGHIFAWELFANDRREQLSRKGISKAIHMLPSARSL